MRRRTAPWLPDLVLGLALGLAATACTRDPMVDSPHRSEHGELVIVTRSAGELRAVSSVDLVTPPSTYRLRIARLAPDGMMVEPGMPIVEYDTEEVAKELRDRQSDLDSARKELDQAVIEERSDNERLSVELQRAEIELTKATIRASRSGDVTSSHDLEKARADVTSYEIATRERKRALDLGRERHTKKKRSLQARIRKAEQDVKLAEAQLAALSLTAPLAGTVLLAETWGGGTMRKFQVGDTAWDGQLVASLPDLSKMEALLFVEEADIEAIRVGQVVTVRLDAAADRSFSGRVTTIPGLAESLSWWNPAKVFKVVATLDSTDPELMRPGLRLQAEIEIERHQDVVTVPIEAVAEAAGQTYVVDPSGTRHPVELGPRNDDRVIIASGLAAATRLAVPGGPS